MQAEEQLNQNYKYYTKAKIVKKFLFGQTFDLHFDNIKKCIMVQHVPIGVNGVFQWFTMNQQSIPQNMQQLQKKLPILVPNFKPTSQNKIRYTWIGHSTAVISIQNVNFLIDPVFEERIGSSKFGYVRFRKAACKLEDLPKIDAVLVSHDHYDHLQQTTLQFLNSSQTPPTFFVGLKSADVFPKKCKIQQMNWTDKKQFIVNGKIFEITFVPAAHYSRRGFSDLNKRLWGGFIIKTPTGKKIYYAGDTGYCQIFKELGAIYKGFDLSILPIGAYLPRKLLQPQHIDPQQAVIIHNQIKSKKSVGVHWGTFPLGKQNYCAARDDLQQAKKKHNLEDQSFVTIDHGGSLEIDS